MNHPFSHYAILAELFVYPDEHYADRVRSAQKLLGEKYPDAAARLEPFSSFMSQASIFRMQELYLRTFDVQAITTLDIGYVLFGDEYKRGAMLVHLNNEHAQVDNPCHNELADHLPNVLRLLPLLKDDDFREELIDRIIAPALRKIINEFSLDKIDQKEKVYLKHHKTLIEGAAPDGTLYRHLVTALYTVIQNDFRLSTEKVTETSSVFLKGIGTEIRLEAEDA